MSTSLLPQAGWHLETAAAFAAESAIALSDFSNPFKTMMELAYSHAPPIRKAGPIRVTRPSVTTKAAERTYRWLPFAAERYNISADLSNYVIVPVSVIVSELPNRNLVAFSFDRLTEFNPELGMLGYESFRGKPTFTDHVNQDFTRAKGVILDVGFRPLTKAVGGLYKVVNLCAFDRSVDPMLASSILSGSVNQYSMGAMVNGYRCSICTASTNRPNEPKCGHIPADRKTLRAVNVNGKPVLAHWFVGSFRGFETSALIKSLPGAFPSAVHEQTDLLQLSKYP